MYVPWGELFWLVYMSTHVSFWWVCFQDVQPVAPNDIVNEKVNECWWCFEQVV